MFLRQFHSLLLVTTKYPQHVVRLARTKSRWAHRRSSKIFLPHANGSELLESNQVLDITDEVEEAEKLRNSKYKKVQSLKPSPTVTPESKAKDNLNHDKLVNDTISQEHLDNNFDTEKTTKILEKRQVQINKTKQFVNNLRVFDDHDEIIYEKCKDNDGRVSSLLVKLKSKKERQKMGMVLVEGWRLIVDGLLAKCKLQYVIFSNKDDLKHIEEYLPKNGVKLFKVPYKEIQLWSGVETSPGIFGIFETLSADKIKRRKPFPIQLICDNIRIPGNLGGILRTASGVGCEKVLLTKGCVDLWDPKVIRSAAGAHFRIPVESNIDWETLLETADKDTSVFIADNNNDIDDTSSNTWSVPIVPYYSVQYPNCKHITLIIGGETEGISEESYRFALSRNGVRINVPLQEGVDSLNTGMAAAVIAFEIKKQLLQAWTTAKLDKENALSNG